MPHEPQFSERATGAILRALASDYRSLNWNLFGDQLAPAPLALGDDQSRLGCWHTDPRRIELSRQLVFERSWGVVLEVLKHEMAHQFVEEVLKVREDKAHGPAFQEVCNRLGIDGRATGLPEAGATNEANGDGASILRRIAKLMALAESPNPHEAEAAMRTAQRLMLKHNLSQIHEPRGPTEFGFVHLGRPTGRASEAERVLAGLLGEFFFVQPIWVSVFRVEDGKRVNALEITGRRENLAMAEHVYSFLLHAADSLWTAHKRAFGIRKNADRQAYRAGVIRGFSDKLRAERTMQQGEGLVWVGDAETENHFRRRHPRVRSTRSNSSASSTAASHGRKAGKQLILHRPLNEPARARGRALPPPK